MFLTNIKIYISTRRSDKNKNYNICIHIKSKKKKNLNIYLNILNSYKLHEEQQTFFQIASRLKSASMRIQWNIQSFAIIVQ